MQIIIAYVIAGISVTGLIALWFAVAFNRLVDKHQEVMAAKEQIKVHYEAYRKERGGQKEEIAKRMLDTSRLIYQESVNEYNRFYSNPMYHFPGFLLGFRFIRAA